MAIRINPDGSMTVGILDDEQKQEVKDDKPKKGKAKDKGDG